MSGTHTSRGATLAVQCSAVAQHDYARTAERPANKTRDGDIGRDTVVLSSGDPDDRRDESASPPGPTRKESIQSLGTAISNKAMSKRGGQKIPRQVVAGAARVLVLRASIIHPRLPHRK